MSPKKTPKRSSHDNNDIVEAVKRIRLEGQSLRSVSKAMKIPRTTLQRHLANVNENIKEGEDASPEKLKSAVDNVTKGSPPVNILLSLHCSTSFFTD